MRSEVSDKYGDSGTFGDGDNRRDWHRRRGRGALVGREEKAREYDEFLSRKVEASRASRRAGLGRSNDEVEAEFAARRASVVSGA